MTIRTDPSPLTAHQLKALGAGAARQLGWGLWAVRSEVAGWRSRAAAIADPVGRSQALEALTDKRPLLDGAAFFWTLPDRRRPELLRLLVAFQALANYHDHASERAGAGLQGHEPGSSMGAFVDAVDAERPLIHYGGDAATDDVSGYLQALARTCRTACHALPHYGTARPLLIREVQRARSLDIEHDPDPRRRAGRLRRFAASEFGDRADASWWELTAGAASLLTAIVLLALAADEQTTGADLEHAVDTYTLVASASAFLDNYVDREEDREAGTHNYLDYYPDGRDAVRGIGLLLDRSLRDASTLRHAERHVVIIASMVALYLSSDSARSAPMRASTRHLIASGGSLTAFLVPILRGWRLAYGETKAC